MPRIDKQEAFDRAVREGKERCSLCGGPTDVDQGGDRAEWYLCADCEGTGAAREAGYTHIREEDCVLQAAGSCVTCKTWSLSELIREARALHEVGQVGDARLHLRLGMSDRAAAGTVAYWDRCDQREQEATRDRWGMWVNGYGVE